MIIFPIKLKKVLPRYSFDPHYQHWRSKDHYDAKPAIQLVGYDHYVNLITNTIDNFILHIDFLKSIGEMKSLNFLLRGNPGMGKCEGRNTPILLYDGHIKMIQDINVGDQLMGDDSQPRMVLSTTKGRDSMFKVVPTKGQSYTVNGPHVLVLTDNRNPTPNWSSNDKRYRVAHPYGQKTHSKLFSVSRYGSRDAAFIAASDYASTMQRGDDVFLDISLQDYFRLPVSRQKRLVGVRASVDFEAAEVLPIDSYIVGHWLGDGTTTKPEIITMDAEVVQYYKQWTDNHGLIFKTAAKVGKATTYSIRGNQGSNIFRNFLHEHDFANCGKYIPHGYKTASRDDRLSLLAGVIDGSLSCGCYDVLQKRERLLDDIIFVARSLGFAAYKTECQKICYNNGVKGTYYCCCISGDVHLIPVLIPHKKAHVRKGNKNVLHYGFEIEPEGNKNILDSH